MNINLEKLGMYRGQQYEAIITTLNENGKTNAAPFGVFCKGQDKIMCRIFKGSTSLENILNEKEFVVNITNNPLMFTLATIDTIPDEYLSKIDSKERENKELVYLTDSEAYFIVKVDKVSEGLREDNIKKSGLFAINGEVTEIKTNIPNPKAFNRAIHELINSLVNYTRIDLVNEEKQNEFLDKFKESERIIKKVGNTEEKEAINLLKEQLIAKNYKLD
ncbi:MAG: DUF447 family protein [archaeon]|nr:DUF447 family protein [archaeon]